jgi:hypothetical protein
VIPQSLWDSGLRRKIFFGSEVKKRGLGGYFGFLVVRDMSAVDILMNGKRVKIRKPIQSDRFIVAIEVEMVIPPDDPSEPCL